MDKNYVRDLRGLSDVQTNCLEQIHTMHKLGMAETDPRYIAATKRFDDAHAKLRDFMLKA